MTCHVCGDTVPFFAVCCDLLVTELDVDRDLDGSVIERARA